MNKYLEKVAASNKGNRFLREFKAGFRRSPTTSKIGLGMSAVGLGMGVANFANSIKANKHNQARQELEAKSLATLGQIANTLKKPSKVVVVDPKTKAK